MAKNSNAAQAPALETPYAKTRLSQSVKIVVIQRGWVVVGRLTKEGDICHLRDASVVRIWGTTKGLGELAANGPTSNTKLDPCPQIDFDRGVVILEISCAADAWGE